MSSSTDRIEKVVHLKAPRSRVWRAITDSGEFGEWFLAVFTEPFRAGEAVRGRMTYPGYEYLKFDVFVEEMVPENRFSFRWHPDEVDPDADTSHEPTTLVTFTLEDSGDGGTVLTMVESGFDSIPGDRGENAKRNNTKGWDEQAVNIANYLREHP
jgi:uncharacterized protein YndB with AHSA1/START domain